MVSDRKTRISRRAYEIWLAEGRIDGKHDEHWHRAEREIDAEDSRPLDPIDEEIFKRDLNEVHLLIDFVSGRPDKNLGDLTVPDPTQEWQHGQAGQKRPNLDPAEAVRRIAQIRWPP